MPYWNWSETRSIPDFFFGDDNPLNDNTRVVDKDDEISDGDMEEFVGPDVVADIIKNPDFASFGGEPGFRGEDEVTPHNFIHRWIGFRPGQPAGNMVRGQSPLDPIFWLHHCNIDRHFSNWLALGHVPPSDDEWRDESFANFFDREGNPSGGDLPVKKMLKSDDLGYAYDKFDVPPPTPTPTPERGRVIASVVANRAILSDVVAPFVSAPLGTTNVLEAFRTVATNEGGKRAVRLRIKTLQPPKDMDAQNIGELTDLKEFNIGSADRIAVTFVLIPAGPDSRKFNKVRLNINVVELTEGNSVLFRFGSSNHSSILNKVIERAPIKPLENQLRGEAVSFTAILVSDQTQEYSLSIDFADGKQAYAHRVKAEAVLLVQVAFADPDKFGVLAYYRAGDSTIDFLMVFSREEENR